VTVLKPVPEAPSSNFGYQFQAAWSPDSRQVVFEYYQPGAEPEHYRELILCGLDDFKPRPLLATRYGFTALFFVDAERLVAGASDAIDLVDTRTGVAQRLLSGAGQGLTKIKRVGDSIECQVGPDAERLVRRVAIPAKEPR